MDLADRLYTHCAHTLDPSLGIAIFCLTEGRLITSHFNPEAAVIWAVPSPRMDTIASQIVGNDAMVLFPKSQHKAIEEAFITRKPLLLSGDIPEINTSDRTSLKISAWDDSEPEIEFTIGSYSNGASVVILAISHPPSASKPIAVSKTIWELGDPKRWAVLRERIDEQAEEAEALQISLTKWVTAFAALLSLGWVTLTHLPGVQHLLPMSAEERVELASKDLRELLKDGYYGLPDPQSNGLFYFQYSANCSSRRLLGTYAPLIKEEAFDGVKERNTAEKGWPELLAAHSQRSPFLLKRSSYSEDHPIRQLMISLGVQEIITYPILGKGNCPLGYLSTGYTQLLRPGEEDIIIQYLAQFVEQNIDKFPSDRGKSIYRPLPPQRGDNTSGFVTCQEINGVHICSLRSRSPAESAQPLQPPPSLK